MRQSEASARTSTREIESKAPARARRDAATRRVLARSPSWHGQNDGQERPNLVYELDRAVLHLGEVMDHTQADLGRQVWPPSRRPLGLISWGLEFLRKVFKLKKYQGQKLKEKCTCCTKCISGPEVKRFSTAKILQKVMQHFAWEGVPSF